MSEIPITVFLAPLLGVAALVWVLARKKRMMAEGEKMYANFRLADVAQRMGLAIVEGAPEFNLMMAYARHNDKDFVQNKGFWGAVSGDGKKQTRAILRGSPNGRPTEFLYFYQTEIEHGYTQNTLYHTFECRLSVQVARPFPEFEVVLRNPSAGMESPPEAQLPQASFGDPMIDQKFMLLAADPRVGPAIAPAMAQLASLNFFHLRAHSQAITHHATMMGSSVAMYSLEQLQYAMDQIGRALEGYSPRATARAS